MKITVTLDVHFLHHRVFFLEHFKPRLKTNAVGNTKPMNQEKFVSAEYLSAI